MTTFVSSREIPAPPGAVFAAIADPLRLARWWGPRGFTNTFATCDLVPGGRWVFSMHGPDGRTYPNESVFVSITPGRELVVQHVSPPRFELRISLEESPAGTLLVWRQTFADDSVAEMVRPVVEPANEHNLDRLTEEVLAHGPAAP